MVNNALDMLPWQLIYHTCCPGNNVPKNMLSWQRRYQTLRKLKTLKEETLDCSGRIHLACPRFACDFACHVNGHIRSTANLTAVTSIDTLDFQKLAGSCTKIFCKTNRKEMDMQ